MDPLKTPLVALLAHTSNSYSLPQQQTALQVTATNVTYHPGDDDGDTLQPSELSHQQIHSTIPSHVCIVCVHVSMCAHINVLVLDTFSPLAELHP